MPLPAACPLPELVARLDTLLSSAGFPDYPGSCNGLQLENTTGTVTRVAVAVDACEAVIRQALADKADLLIVHHGLFWTGIPPLIGPAFRKIRAAIEGNLAVYSNHLPLDAHPDVGNNSLLLRALDLPPGIPAFEFKSKFIGRLVELDSPLPLDDFLQRVHTAIGPAKLAPGGPDHIRKLAVCSGGSGTSIAEAAALGADTFLVGEGAHWTFTAAEELGVNLIYAGHYATETFGVKALGAWIQNATGLPWRFIDHPSGL